MKRITIALLSAVACCYLFVSCHKPDLPPSKKLCQIKRIEDIYNPNPTTTTGRITTYAYNYKRLPDSITVRPAFTTEPPLWMKINYNTWGLPTSTRDNIDNASRTHKLIYQNGRVVRIDKLGTDNLYHLKYYFLYDSLGRIVERKNADSLTGLIFEYAGTSRNFIRKLNMQVLRPGPFPLVGPFTAFEYQYDDKVNPQTTWPNTTLVPFYHEVVFSSVVDDLTQEFEPIPENNWTYQMMSASLRGILLKAREYFYTYQYDDVYPVKYDLKVLHYNPFIGPAPYATTTGVTHFFYDCTGNNIHY